MTHKISTDRAYEIDLDWNASDSDDMLRIVSYRTAGNGSRSVLCIPSNDNAPRYEYKRHDPETGEYAPGYYHRGGPTIDEWQYHNPAAAAAQIAEYTEAFEIAAIERHDDIH